MKTYLGEWRYSSTYSLTSALEGEWRLRYDDDDDDDDDNNVETTEVTEIVHKTCIIWVCATLFKASFCQMNT
jgi:hypothetical protein